MGKSIGLTSAEQAEHAELSRSLKKAESWVRERISDYNEAMSLAWTKVEEEQAAFNKAREAAEAFLVNHCEEMPAALREAWESLETAELEIEEPAEIDEPDLDWIERFERLPLLVPEPEPTPEVEPLYRATCLRCNSASLVVCAVMKKRGMTLGPRGLIPAQGPEDINVIKYIVSCEACGMDSPLNNYKMVKTAS